MAAQLEFFDTAARTVVVDPDDVRAELLGLLATASDARDVAPWDARTQRFHRVVFPQKARWLKDRTEAERLCGAFATELDRIDLLLAA